MTRGTPLALLIALIGLPMFLINGGCGNKTSAPSVPETLLGGRPRSEFLLQHDRFDSATDPATVPAAEAEFLEPDDEVFGVFEGGKARAYPLTMIAYHHVINDVVGGVPIAVTY